MHIARLCLQCVTLLLLKYTFKVCQFNKMNNCKDSMTTEGQCNQNYIPLISESQGLMNTL